MLDQLFKFPIVMIDGDNEERKIKEKLRFGDIPNTEGEEQGDYDMVFGEAEYPYWDLIGIEDRWLPSRESFIKAMNGQFEGCIVRFVNAGQLLVPWTRKKFKAALLKFAEEYTEAHPPKDQRVVKIKTLTAEEYKNITGTKDNEE